MAGGGEERGGEEGKGREGKGREGEGREGEGREGGRGRGGGGGLTVPKVRLGEGLGELGLPTPVGPQNMSAAMGLLGSLSPTLARRTAREMA